ncbi:MAG: hypothetical protein CMJ78_04095 [Planctomycetaceae bacterium]|nr:hypothetical protein [Planctomycetaceae bacterium]
MSAADDELIDALRAQKTQFEEPVAVPDIVHSTDLSADTNLPSESDAAADAHSPIQGSEPETQETIGEEVDAAATGNTDPGQDTPQPINLNEIDSYDRYEKLSTLGRGGMGAVLCMYDHRTRRRVAFKEILSSRAESSPIVSRFLNEAKSPLSSSIPVSYRFMTWARSLMGLRTM